MTEGEKTFNALRKRAERLGWDLTYSVMVPRPHRVEYVLSGKWYVLRQTRNHSLNDVRKQIVYMERTIRKSAFNPITMKNKKAGDPY